MSAVKTVKIKDPYHPCGEIVVNADDPRAKQVAEEAPKPKRRGRKPKAVD